MKKYILLPILLAGATGAFAQDYNDAARFGMLMPQGTARSASLAGAVGAVGADFTALSINPAGIGLYRRGEFSFSAGLHTNRNEANYLNGSDQKNGTGFSITNAGLVSVSGSGTRNSGWRNWGFGIGINRLADFTRDYTYTGRNDSSSFGESFVIDAEINSARDEDWQNSLGALAYETGLVDYDSVSDRFYTLADVFGGPVNQTKTVRERGGISELAFSVGGNYNETLMLGATVGLPILRYQRDLRFQETDATGSLPDFQESTYNSILTTSGAGINLKVGAIYKPSDAFRFGAAFHSPTWFSLNDMEQVSLTTNTENFLGVRSSSLLETEFTYSMRTPWRAVLSATGFLGNSGFLSVDYEYVDYKSSSIIFETNKNQDLVGTGRYQSLQQERNDALKANLQGASNLRIGAEFHLQDIYFRAGTGFYGSPYKNERMQGTSMLYTLGLGYRNRNFFADLGVQMRDTKGGEYAYVLPYNNVTIAPEARFVDKRTAFLFTVGKKF